MLKLDTYFKRGHKWAHFSKDGTGKKGIFFSRGGTHICKLLPCAHYMGGFFSRISLTLGGLYEKIPLKLRQN